MTQSFFLTPNFLRWEEEKKEVSTENLGNLKKNPVIIFFTFFSSDSQLCNVAKYIYLSTLF